MASRESRIKALVVKKTKLGESDLILHLLAEDGSSVRVVAKGARKPRNSSSATLDLFNTAQLSVIEGKSLGIAKDSRLLVHHDALHSDPLRFAAASVIAEVADAGIQPDLPIERLYDMTCVTMNTVADAPDATLPLVVAAYGFKLTALLGMRPSFTTCVICDAPLPFEKQSVRFSFFDGGAMCEECASVADTTSISTDALTLANFLLYSPFSSIVTLDDQPEMWDVFALAEMWLRTQMGARLKSLASFKAISGCLQTPTVI